jgi:hypothetical protein
MQLVGSEMGYDEDIKTDTAKKRLIHRVLLAEISFVSLALALNALLPYPIGVLLAISQLSLGNYLLINDMEKLGDRYQIEMERRRILRERNRQ